MCLVGPYLSSEFPTKVSVLDDHIDYVFDLVGMQGADYKQDSGIYVLIIV
jgi:hypothetical protein